MVLVLNIFLVDFVGLDALYTESFESRNSHSIVWAADLLTEEIREKRNKCGLELG